MHGARAAYLPCTSMTTPGCFRVTSFIPGSFAGGAHDGKKSNHARAPTGFLSAPHHKTNASSSPFAFPRRSAADYKARANKRTFRFSPHRNWRTDRARGVVVVAQSALSRGRAGEQASEHLTLPFPSTHGTQQSLITTLITTTVIFVFHFPQ